MTTVVYKPLRVPPSVTGPLYIIIPAIIVLLAGFNVIDNEAVSVWTSVVLALVAAVVAIANSDAAWRQAVYGLAAAAQAVFQLYGLGTDSQWASITGLIVAFLSIGLAGVFTPKPDNPIVVEGQATNPSSDSW